MGRSRVIWTLVVAFGGGAFLGGCASDSSELELTQRPSTPALLFDAEPGYPSGSDLAYRSDWPSAESIYQFGESVFYQERFIDLQGFGPFGHGHSGYTYRRFSTYRQGFGRR